MTRTSLDHLDTGDTVAIAVRKSHWSNRPSKNYRLYTITSRTKAQAVIIPKGDIGNVYARRIRLSDGRIIGSGTTLYNEYAVEATPELLEAEEAAEAADRRYMDAINNLSGLEKALQARTMTVEQMEVLGAAWALVKTTVKS